MKENDTPNQCSPCREKELADDVTRCRDRATLSMMNGGEKKSSLSTPSPRHVNHSSPLSYFGAICRSAGPNNGA